MRTLVEAEGSIATSVARPGARGVPVDKKASFIIREFRKYRINIAGISETKWFGQDMYEVEGYTILHSGRPIPGDTDAVERNEGVGIVLDPQLKEAWRRAGEVWKGVSSRIVMVRVKLDDGYGRQIGWNISRPTYATIISVYAPTHRSSQGKKDEFYADLQKSLDGVDRNDVLLLLGDFNARVGSNEKFTGMSSWDGVKGCHGVGKMNESGEALLSFCALNELVIMNTTFEKKDIHKYTWQHPGSKKWHCIDYVIMRQAQRKFCCDVTVLRSAECWTDHKLLRAQLRLRTPSTKVARVPSRKRFAVSALRSETTTARYKEAIREEIGDWRSEATGLQKWEAIRDGLMNAAETTLGHQKRNQPDWFKENETILRKHIDKRNLLFSKWLRTQHQSDRQRYVAQRRLVASEVKRVKNEWFQEKAREVDNEMMKGIAGRGVWQGLRDIQRGRSGLQPVRPRAIRNVDGQMCMGPEETLQRWRHHFGTVLNVTSSYTEDIIQAQHQYPIRHDMSEPPTEEEICEAMDRLKGNKASGRNGILPEMLKNCGPDTMNRIYDLFNTVWREGEVLTVCDNWRGISLLDVVGKLFAKVIQQRLQGVVEDVVSDSQCGFHKGRGCTGMIFCARQLVEKAREHNSKVFILFVDLKKAYDSIPRQALWLVLQKYGIPPVIINLIQSLHEGMKAEVSVSGGTTPAIEVNNGLRQGCTIAPTLFNLYFNMVITCWRDRCQPFGVDIFYKCSGKLTGERTRSPSSFTATELLFADDAAAVSTSRESMERAALVLEEVTSEWGLTVSVSKTKLLVAGVNCEDTDLQPIYIRGGAIEAMTEFKYLGTIIEANGSIQEEVEDRISKASRVFGALKGPVFSDSDLHLPPKGYSTVQ